MVGGTCALVTGIGDSGDQWKDWQWVFGTGEIKKEKVTPERVFILLNKARKPNEISGTVQFSRDFSYSGLIIELTGTLKFGIWNKEIDVIPTKLHDPSLPKISVIYYPLSVAKDGEITSKAFAKYPFILKLPAEILPPTIEYNGLATVQYKLCVLMYKGKDHYKLHEKIIFYPGQLAITDLFHLKGIPHPVLRCASVELDGVRVQLELPKEEYLITEDIGFTIKLCDNLRVGVKKLLVMLVRNTSLKVKGDEKQRSDIIDCVTFKRFLKREVCNRNGKFKSGKRKVASFERHEKPQLKITYEIKVHLETMDGKKGLESIDLTIGTHYIPPSPSAPGPGPSAPFYDENPTPTAPSASCSLASSMLSLALFPPSYSRLSSRSTSIASIETLPPRYEDLHPKSRPKTTRNPKSPP